MLGIFRVGRCFVVILLQFQIFETDFGLQKLNWDNFVMAHTNFLRVFSGFHQMSHDRRAGHKHRMIHPVGFRANRMISEFTGFHPVPDKL